MKLRKSLHIQAVARRQVPRGKAGITTTIKLAIKLTIKLKIIAATTRIKQAMQDQHMHNCCSLH